MCDADADFACERASRHVESHLECKLGHQKKSKNVCDEKVTDVDGLKERTWTNRVASGFVFQPLIQTLFQRVRHEVTWFCMKCRERRALQKSCFSRSM